MKYLSTSEATELVKAGKVRNAKPGDLESLALRDGHRDAARVAMIAKRRGAEPVPELEYPWLLCGSLK